MNCTRSSIVMIALLAATGHVAASEFDADQLHTLAVECAPSVAPATMVALLQHESAGNALAIGVNGTVRKTLTPTDAAAASAAANKLLAEKKSIDLGLGQINSSNLDRLGLDTTTVFDACQNVAAAAQVLQEAYLRLRPGAASDQAALNKALSTYNTGSPTAGIANGYVAKVRGKRYTVPALSPQSSQTATVVTVEAKRAPAPAWDVFGSARPQSIKPDTAAVMVFQNEGQAQ